MISTLRSHIQPACEVAVSAEQIMNELHKLQNNVSKNCVNSIAEVKDVFQKISNSLSCREKTIIATIRKYSDIKLSRLDAQYQMLETHHDSILEDVSHIEKLMDDNENVTIISQKQVLCEQLETHEQAILSLEENLKDARRTSFLSFKVSLPIMHQLDDLGKLEEYIKEADKSSHSVRQVIISEEDDPYNEVPLRFEDISNDAFQKEVRVDENTKHIEYESENKPIKLEENTCKPIFPKQEVVPTVSKKPPPPPKPRPSLLPKPVNKETENAPKTLPRPRTHKRTAKLQPQSQFVHKDIQYVPDNDSSDEYEKVDDYGSQASAQDDVPPPLPPSHPHKKPRVLPKPHKRRISDNQDLASPSQICSPFPCESEVIQPSMVLDSTQLSRPFCNENVYPNGVCCSTTDNTMIVTDINNDCIRMIDGSGNFIGKIGKPGRSGGQFREPSAVTVDANNYILVCERDNQRIQKFSPSGKYITKFGQKTLIGSLLNDPLGIAVSPNGQIAVSDWDKSQILYFNKTGKHIKSIGTDKHTNLIKFPAGIAFTSNGNLLVTDRGNHCIWIINERGDIINKIGSHGSNLGQLDYPYGIAVGLDDSIIVTESGNCRVSIFTQEGKFKTSFGKSGSKPGMFNHPRHVCINTKGEIIVADEMNNRIQIFNV